MDESQDHHAQKERTQVGRWTIGVQVQKTSTNDPTKKNNIFRILE